MRSLQEWRRHIDRQIEETTYKKAPRVEGRRQKTEDRGQKTGRGDSLESLKQSRRQKTEDREQKTEDRGQKTEDRGQRTEAEERKREAITESTLSPAEILSQKDKGHRPPTREKEKEERPEFLADLTQILSQKDKKAKSKEEIKLPTIKQPEQTELPLPDLLKVEGGKIDKSLFDKRQELIKQLLDPQVNLEEAALLLNVCKSTVRHYTDSNLLPHIRTIGGQRRFRFSDILVFLEKREKGEIKTTEDTESTETTNEGGSGEGEK